MRTPSTVLDELVAADPARPRLTFYDDTTGERIELSGKVLANWVAKAANALQEAYDVAPGTVVLLDLPSPHWRQAYWALGVWSVGATLTLDDSEGADVLVTTDPGGRMAEDSDEVVAVALPALSRSFGAELRSGVMDEARELATYGDQFAAWDSPGPDEAALVHRGERTTYAQVLDDRDWPDGLRVLVTDTDPGAALTDMLAAWGAGGSVVLVHGATDPAVMRQRTAEEGVDLEARHRR